jgi:hypothetical protein
MKLRGSRNTKIVMFCCLIPLRTHIKNKFIHLPVIEMHHGICCSQHGENEDGLSDYIFSYVIASVSGEHTTSIFRV